MDDRLNLPWFNGHYFLLPNIEYGFNFHKDKLYKQSKCLQCHASWIEDPLIVVAMLETQFLKRILHQDSGFRRTCSVSARASGLKSIAIAMV